MSLKFSTYLILSFFSMFLMIIYACITREQFYPIILLLITSKISFLLLLNLFFILLLLIIKIFIKIFFSKLRDIENELILERLKYSIIETSLALTIFRNDITIIILGFFFYFINY